MEKKTKTNDEKPLVAYFSMEYAISDDIPSFTGGLGILAGDTLLEASDQERNFISVGLFFHKTYLEQKISEKGKQGDLDYNIDPEVLNLESVVDENNKEIIVEVPLGNRKVKVKAWKKMVGNIPLFLLDTQLPENLREDQKICDQTYSGDKSHRLQQEIVLGIGGVKMIKAMGYEPSCYHSNEGHCAFLILEVLNQYRKTKEGSQQSLTESIEQIKEKIVFTNHTIIAAGNDVFSNELISIYLSRYAQELKITPAELIQMGQAKDTAMFLMMLLAARNCKKTNAVSKLHANVLNDTWSGFDFIPITNGVYHPRWIHEEVKNIWDLDQIELPSKTDFWNAHQKAKKELMEEIEKRTGTKLDSEILTICWARRITEYKRPTAILQDVERLQKILNNDDKPVQILIAGKSHRRDINGQQCIKELYKLGKKEIHLQFIPNYNITLSKLLVAGSDIWLNTPIRGYEACGTSGMKACLNGVLQMTVEDGWTDEVDWTNIGWTLDDENPAESFYKLLETEVSDLYYNRDDQGIPSQWVERMIKSSQVVRKPYGTKRMLNDYYEKLYEI